MRSTYTSTNAGNPTTLQNSSFSTPSSIILFTNLSGVPTLVSSSLGFLVHFTQPSFGL
jgi:hypothetical protein